MIRLLLDRIYKGITYTIGRLYINGEYFCDTIEDVVRELNSKEDKVYAKTAIPKGIYKVVMTYSPKFKRILPLLLDVPYFTGIRIHNGTDENNSSGCIIVGENKVKGKVINSKKTLDKLINRLSGVEDIEIEIKEKEG